MHTIEIEDTVTEHLTGELRMVTALAKRMGTSNREAKVLLDLAVRHGHAEYEEIRLDADVYATAHGYRLAAAP